MIKDNPFVVSISAVSGGGKTTIAKHLHDKLDQSNVLYFDHYDFNGPEDIIDWVNRGANYDEWDLTPLIKDIKKLQNEFIDYIILDYPFAHQNSKVSAYIDLALFIDTPLDIAMARRITRDFQNDSIEEILNDVEHYVSDGRKGYLEMLKSVKTKSDLIVDGALSVSEIVSEVYNSILDKK